MKNNINRWLVRAGFLIASISLLSGFAYAKDLQVVTGKPGSVSFVKAEVVRLSGGEIVVGGLLNRAHRLPMTGHIHAYSITKSGELIGQSKHRVAGLNSQRGGSMRIPFKISIENSYEETRKILLEYHAPGHTKDGLVL